MRSVSYVQRVALDFSGSLFPNAICLGDVDNDAVGARARPEAQLGTAHACGRGGPLWDGAHARRGWRAGCRQA